MTELPPVPAAWRDYQRQVLRAMDREGMTRDGIRATVVVMISVLCGHARPEYRGLLGKPLELAIHRGAAALYVLDVVLIAAPLWVGSQHVDGDRPVNCESCTRAIRSTVQLRNERAHRAGVIWLCDQCAIWVAEISPSTVCDVGAMKGETR